MGSDCCAHEVVPNEILPTVLLFLPQFLENTKNHIKMFCLNIKELNVSVFDIIQLSPLQLNYNRKEGGQHCQFPTHYVLYTSC